MESFSMYGTGGDYVKWQKMGGEKVPLDPVQVWNTKYWTWRWEQNGTETEEHKERERDEKMLINVHEITVR